MGYEKTGLGRRIALVLVQRLGGRTPGLGCAIVLADLVLAPFTPLQQRTQCRHDLPRDSRHTSALRVAAG